MTDQTITRTGAALCPCGKPAEYVNAKLAMNPSREEVDTVDEAIARMLKP